MAGFDYENEQATDEARTNEEGYEDMQMQFRETKYGKFGHATDAPSSNNCVFFNEEGLEG